MNSKSRGEKVDLEGEDRIIEGNGDAVEPKTSKKDQEVSIGNKYGTLGENMGEDMGNSLEKRGNI